jgi:uncharacterized protein (DUF1778 family)
MEAPVRNAKTRGHRETLNLRNKPGDRGLIDRAAELLGKTRTDFVLDAARRAAEDAVLDRTLFVVGPDAFDTLRARLDETPQPNENLRRALETRAPWEWACRFPRRNRLPIGITLRNSISALRQWMTG